MSGSVPTRKVLILTYVFPPVAYVGGYRTAKYCKYLQEFGWTPIVVTVHPRHAAHLDVDLASDLPGDLDVLRTPDCDPAKWMAWLSDRMHRLEGWVRKRVRKTEAPTDYAGASVPAPSRIKRLVSELLLATPDSHVFWVPIAILAGAWALLTRPIDVIYSSSPPHSVHLAATILARLFRKPLVVDFRDPWVVNQLLSSAVASSVPHARVQRRLKRLVTRSASRVICVSAGERRELLAERPEIAADSVAVITNGYDEGDIRKDDVTADAGHFTLTHAGTLYRGCGDEFFAAVESLVRQERDVAGCLRVNLVGVVDESYAPMLARLSATGAVRHLGFQPKSVAINVMRRSDVLLILLGGGIFPASEVPSKTFEYLALGKRILAIAPDGDLSEMLEASGLGLCVPPGNPGRLTEAMLSLYRARHDRPAPATSTYLRQFTRRSLAAKLSDVLTAVTLTARSRRSV